MITTTSTFQRGLSLIELLIALAISSLLILGISQIYIDNKGSYLFQQGQSDNIENSRYTLLIFEEELQRTGYRSRPDDTFENIYRPYNQDGCVLASGEVIKYTAANQLLCIRYQPNVPGVATCDGTTLATSDDPYVHVEPAVVRLQVQNGELLCNGQTIVGNLLDFRFEFGVSTPDSREVEHYTLTPAAGEVIRAVRYSALLRSRSDNLANDTQNVVYSRWRNKWYDEENTAAPDRALYLTAESTVTLRNMTR